MLINLLGNQHFMQVIAGKKKNIKKQRLTRRFRTQSHPLACSKLPQGPQHEYRLTTRALQPLARHLRVEAPCCVAWPQLRASRGAVVRRQAKRGCSDPEVVGTLLRSLEKDPSLQLALSSGPFGAPVSRPYSLPGVANTGRGGSARLNAHKFCRPIPVCQGTFLFCVCCIFASRNAL